jgi:hypothetical protein
MADPTNDPHAEEWKRAMKNGSYQNRSGLIVAGGALVSALAVLGVWVYAYHDQSYVYVRSGQDASFEIIKRGIVLAGFVGLVVALVLTRVLGVRDNAYTKALGTLFKR